MPTPPCPFVVTLDPPDFDLAVAVGLRRFQESRASGRDHARSITRGWTERLRDETVGCLAELAVARAKDVEWSRSVNTFKRVPDVDGHEVRATWRADGRLIVRDDDPGDRWFIFVTGDGPAMTIHGSIRGRDAKQDCWLSDPHGRRPSWFVPQHALLRRSRPHLAAVS